MQHLKKKKKNYLHFLKLKEISSKESQRKGHMTHQGSTQTYNSLSDGFYLLWTPGYRIQGLLGMVPVRVKLLDVKSPIP